VKFSVLQQPRLAAPLHLLDKDVWLVRGAASCKTRQTAQTSSGGGAAHAAFSSMSGLHPLLAYLRQRRNHPSDNLHLRLVLTISLHLLAKRPNNHNLGA
jgi:hypothetical protein